MMIGRRFGWGSRYKPMGESAQGLEKIRRPIGGSHEVDGAPSVKMVGRSLLS